MGRLISEAARAAACNKENWVTRRPPCSITPSKNWVTARVVLRRLMQAQIWAGARSRSGCLAALIMMKDVYTPIFATVKLIFHSSRARLRLGQ